MYSNFFGLSCLPFEDRADSRFYYATPEREETLAAMEYESREGKGATLVLGEPGTGKTLLVRALLPRFGPDDRVVVLTWPAGGDMSLVRETCKAFGVSLPIAYTHARGVARLQKHLTRSLARGQRPILLVDQAEHLTTENMSQLKALMDLQHDGGSALSVILVGTPSLRALLDDPEFAGVRQRFFDERSIDPFDFDTTRQYIRHRLQVAGAGGADVFEPQAIALIYAASGGTPRLINHMCNAGLVAAYGAGLRRVDARIAAEITGSEPPMDEPVSAPAVDLAVETMRDPMRDEPAMPDRPRDAASPMDSSGEPDAADQFAWPTADAARRVLADCDVQFERIERILARADRMAGTSEAAVLRATAVEKHLTELTNDAGRLSARVADEMKRASESAADIRQRVGESLAEAQRRAGMIVEQSDQLPELCDDAAGAVDRIARACERAGGVEADLKSVAEQFADKADAVQERIAVLMSGVKTSEDAHTRLTDTLRTVREATESAARQAQVQRDAESESRTHVESIKDAIESLRGNLDTVRREAVRITTEALQSHERHAEAILERFTQRLQERLAQFDSLDKLDQRVAGVRQSMDDLSDGLDQRVAGVRHSMDELSERLDGTLASTATLTGRIEDAEGRAGALAQRAAGAEQTISKSVARGEEMMLHVQEHCGKVEAAQRSIAATLVDIGAASQRADAAGQQAAKCEQVAARLEAGGAQARQLAEQLEEVVAQGNQLHDATIGALAQAETRVGQLDSHHAAARRLLHELTDANVAAQDSARHADESAQRAQETIAASAGRAEGLISDLTSVNDAAEATSASLAERDGRARDLMARVESLAAPAGEAADRLATLIETAAAQATLITERSESARGLVDDLAAVNRAVIDARQIEASIKTGIDMARAVCDELTEMTQTQREDLSKREAEFEAMLRQVDESAGPVRTFVRRLGEGMTLVKQRTEEMAKQCEDADRQATRLADVVQTIKSAKEIQSSLSATVEQSQAIHGGLTEAAAGAKSIAAKLGDLTATSVELIRRHDETTESAKTLMTELLEQVNETRSSTDSADRLLSEFNKQAQTLARAIRELQARASQVEQSVATAADKPTELIATAQAQAAQLERVCAAVRKVFGGLSKATLEARQLTADFAEARHSATERLECLNAETQRASNTLHEWVEEAIRVQARLEGTLTRAPSISETHPTRALTSMSRMSAPASRIANPSAGGELTMLPDPPEAVADDLPEIDEPAIETAKTRAQQVSALLEEAKLASTTD